MRHRVLLIACVGLLLATVTVHAQQSAEAVGRVRAEPQARSTTVYRLLAGKKAAFDVTGVGQGQASRGSLEMEYRNGRAAMRLQVDNLIHPQRVGAAYTAYVFWGVAADGNVTRLGELPVNTTIDMKADLSAQTVGVLATAEPYAEVERPSSELVLRFDLRKKNHKNAPPASIAKYLGDGGQLYADAGTPAIMDMSTPLLVQGARHAVGIARRAGAVEFAPTEWHQVDVKLEVLEQLWPDHRSNEAKFSGPAREVIRLADAARRSGAERSDSSAAAADRLATAASLARAASEVEAARMLAARTLNYADSVRTAAQQEASDAQQKANAAQQDAGAARRERDDARARLANSISSILDTKREARGLVINLPGVLFKSSEAVLQPAARENLSKLSGILLAYPGAYSFAIGGHTDSVGSDALNDRLSEARAESVRNYLVEAGITASHVTSAMGYGKREPVAENVTAEGRAKNRRVEIVIDDTER